MKLPWPKNKFVSFVALFVAAGLIGFGLSRKALNPGNNQEYGVSANLMSAISSIDREVQIVQDQDRKFSSATDGIDSGVRFPDGSIVPITIMPRAPRRIEYPMNYADVYVSLKTDGLEGDGEAAFAFQNILRTCDRASKSPDEHDKALRMLREEHKVRIPGSENYAQLANPEQLEDYEASLIYEYEQCKGLPISEELTADEWLRISADAGDTQAAMTIAIAEKNAESLGYLRDAWDAGEISAAGWLAQAYRGGWENGRPDLVSAYANEFIYANLSVIAARQSEAGSRRAALIFREMERNELQLSAHEAREAVALAKSILINHPNCCRGIY